MTTVTFFRAGSELCGYRAEGHADYAEYGSDIVCAALSALCQTAEIGIERVAKIAYELETDEASGRRKLMISDTADIRAQAILRTLEEGLLDIEKEYPGFVRITYRERRQTQ